MGAGSALPVATQHSLKALPEKVEAGNLPSSQSGWNQSALEAKIV